MRLQALERHRAEPLGGRSDQLLRPREEDGFLTHDVAVLAQVHLQTGDFEERLKVPTGLVEIAADLTVLVLRPEELIDRVVVQLLGPGELLGRHLGERNGRDHRIVPTFSSTAAVPQPKLMHRCDGSPDSEPGLIAGRQEMNEAAAAIVSAV
ncbi:hypothetical protein GCM10027447_05740 [Glycomyces halotolerans]